MGQKEDNNQIVAKSRVSIFCGYAIEGLWLFLLIAMPLFYYRSHQSFDMPKIQLFCATVVLMMVFWLVKSIEEKKFKIRSGPFLTLLLAYLAVLVLSTIFAFYPEVSFWGSYERFTGLFSYVFLVLACALVYWNANSIDHVKRIFYFLAVGSIPVSIYGLFQYFGYDFLKFTDTGQRFFEIISTMGNSLYLSNYLIMAIPAAFVLLLMNKNIYARILWLATIFIDIWALILTQKRSGFVALVAVAVVAGFLMAWRWRRAAGIALLLLLIIPVIVVALNFNQIANSDFVAQTSYLNRVFSIFDFTDVTIKERLLVWEIAGDIILKRPVLGYGLDSFLYAFDAYYPAYFTEMPENYFDRAHNFILDTAYSTGLVGLLIVTSLFIYAFYHSAKFYFKNKKDPASYLGLGVFVALSGFLAHNIFMFESMTTRYILYLLFVTIALISVISKQEAELAQDNNEKENAKEKQKIKFWSVKEYKLIYYALLIIAAAYIVKFHVFPIAGDYHFNKGMGYGGLEHRAAREQEFLKAMYYIKDVRSSKYMARLAGDYFIFAQNIAEKDAQDRAFEQSVGWYLKAMEKDPKQFKRPDELAQVYMVWSKLIEDEAVKQEKIDLADQYFDQAVALSPGRQMIYWDWGRSLIYTGDLEQGIAKYEYAVGMDPNVGRSHFELGKAYRDTDQLEKARESFDRAIELGHTRGSEDDPL